MAQDPSKQLGTPKTLASILGADNSKVHDPHDQFRDGKNSDHLRLIGALKMLGRKRLALHVPENKHGRPVTRCLCL